MKTQIIALESHDDLISVRDRMSWAKSPRILLVWPRYEQVTLRPVDLRILQQHARYLGAHLGLVTRRGDVRRDAEGFGIPVFSSTAAAQREVWAGSKIGEPVRSVQEGQGLRGSGARHPNLHALRDEVRLGEAGWRSKPAARIGFFAAGVLGVLSIAALFIPHATIKLTAPSQRQIITLPVTAGESIQSVLIAGSVPAHEIKATVTSSQSARVTSQGSIPEDKANGIAQFKNLTQSEVTIPAGTIVYSLTPVSMRFETLNNTHMPGSVNAVVEVPIAAVDAGAASNLPANSIQAIDGNLSLSASVTNPQPTTGGSDRVAVAPSEGDRKRVRDVLMGLLQTQAQDQMRDAIGAKDLLLVNTLKTGDVLQESYDPPAGAAGSLLKLTMRAEFSAQYVRADDLALLAETTLNASVPQGFVPAPETLMFHLVAAPVLDDSGASHFQLQVERVVSHELNLTRANALVRGASPVTAAQVLQSGLQLASPPEIDLSPAWWPWLPLIPFRISVAIQ